MSELSGGVLHIRHPEPHQDTGLCGAELYFGRALYVPKYEYETCDRCLAVAATPGALPEKEFFGTFYGGSVEEA